ncbi:MAG: polyribonucleotide nucleotidyltransferase [Patescibacteria group bacterium]
MEIKEFKTEVGGRELVCQFTDLANQTNGSVIVKYGNSMVLATAVMSKSKKEDLDYFPLTVDYEEKFYAAGQILGSRFMKREGRPSDEAILSGRIIDRTIRPLFNQNMRNEVQVVITVLSIENFDPDILGVVASSLALGVSDIPWGGPVSGIRIAKKKGESGFIVNPTYEFVNSEECEMEMVVCGKDEKNLNMIEVGASEIKEGVAYEALAAASDEIKKIQDFQKRVIEDMGKEKLQVQTFKESEELKNLFEVKLEKDLFSKIFVSDLKEGEGEVAVKNNLKNVFDEWKNILEENLPEEVSAGMHYLDEKISVLLHKEGLLNDRRVDGRAMDEIRPLFAKAGGISPILHGSGIFYRGGTHVFSALTLGGPQDAQIIDGMEVQEKKRFMHHYNFPPFSSGETGRMGGTNRRMIGHGALAEKALMPIIPSKEIFPYTIRLVSESMASNGSTSMASVCASSLSLMDGGVPIKSPVVGIAMGLLLNEKNDPSLKSDYKILTDIQGPEDHHGDMDFKVAGTRGGITAIQLDIKLAGVPIKVLEEALTKARIAREEILDVIEAEIKEPRKELSANAPRIVLVSIAPSKIGLVIGGGGKTINEIKEKTETEIEIEDDGSVFITGKNDGPERAKKIIEEMTHEYAEGEILSGEVVKLADFGAFVKLSESADGLVHISEIAPFRVANVSDVLKEGDIVPVKVKGVDERGKISLSIKEADPEYALKKVPADYASKSSDSIGANNRNGAYGQRGGFSRNRNNYGR